MIDKQTNNDETPVYNILKEIKDKTLDPKTLTTVQRQSCVEVLKLEGQSYAAIAALLQWSEKTIQRDWESICRRNSEKPSPDYALRLIAQMMMKLNSKEEYLTRLANSKEGSMQEKGQAMYFAAKIILEAGQRLQSMGYLPTQPTKIIADVYQHSSDEADPVKLKEEVARIEKILNEEAANPALKAQLDEIKKKIDLVELSQQLKNISDQVSGESNKEERQNG